ncbi:MAG: TetR/AcrR family transcriptional regulator [Solobacterium sp.]|nr:TetR/AcrR family transcriptional regulator [Solobacterium sp.]
MARKAVLEGGKREEIITAAEQLFFTEGFEKTSVRMILEKVGGEVGMFYHYFKSKDELFDVVAQRFFQTYQSGFEAMAEQISTPEDFVNTFLENYEAAMERYRHIEQNMHWTIRSALHESTVMALIPTVQKLLERFGYQGKYPMDIAAGRITADISAAIHSQSFIRMSDTEKKEVLLSLLKDTLGQ